MCPPPEVEIGSAIRADRLEAGLSQHALAQRAGMRIEAISRLERGERNPRFTTLVRLARALDTTPADLVERAGYS